VGKINRILDVPKTTTEKIAYWFGKRPKFHTIAESGRLQGYNAPEVEMAWFDDFIQKYVTGAKEYHFFGHFGSKMFAKKKRLEHSFFYTGETVHTGKPFLEYDDYLLENVDLALSFDCVDSPNYLRFPQWILWCFKPILDKDYVANRVDEINNARSSGIKDAVIICNHDGHKTRQPICDSLSDIMEITYGGRWRNNSRDLWDKYNDDKIRYLHEFKFNICPENRNVKDYVTEKLFEAFAGGAIPIYYGSNNNPEPGIINPDAVLFWDLKYAENNNEVKEYIKALKNDDRLRNEFLSKEKLFAYTVDYVYDTLIELKERLENI